jgi:AcrR family transcriptional regulator
VTRADRQAADEALQQTPGFPDLVGSLDPAQPAVVRMLILAGLACFADKGYNATTTRDIASRAGLSPAGMYVHFPSKAELLARVVGIANGRLLEMLQETTAQHPATPDRLRAIVATFASMLARNHAAGRVANYEYRHLPEDLRGPIDAQRIAFRRLVRETIEAGVDDGSFDVPDADVAARALISMCIDVSRWHTEEEGGDPERLGAAYGDLAIRMVSAAG